MNLSCHAEILRTGISVLRHGSFDRSQGSSLLQALRRTTLLFSSIREINYDHHWDMLINQKRSGWVRKGIPDPESVAQHSLGVVELAYRMSAGRMFDLNKVMLLGLVHDLPESIVTDILPNSTVSSEDKLAREVAAMMTITSSMPNGPMYNGLFLEYCHRLSPEADFVKQVDKLQMVEKALLYERLYPEIDYNGFWKYARAHITDNALTNHLNLLQLSRKQA